MAQQESAKENAAQHKVEEASSDFVAAESSTPIPIPKASTVTKEQFEAILPRYDSVFCYLCAEGLKTGRIPDVAHAKRYVQMDLERYGWIEGLDDSMNVRKEAPDGPFVNKKDLEMLMEWKLKHGKFRPKLQELVASNSEEDVIDTTRAAFKLYSSSDPPKYQEALKMLSKFKGVGPATASLILSVYSPSTAPFFSDELFRWVCWDEKQGWKQQIKYDTKEYNMLWDGIQKLRGRLGDVSAVTLEKVAFVYGKMAEDAKLREYVEEEIKNDELSKGQEGLGTIQESNGDMHSKESYGGGVPQIPSGSGSKKMEAMLQKILAGREQTDVVNAEPAPLAAAKGDEVALTTKEDSKSNASSPALPTAKNAAGRAKKAKPSPVVTAEEDKHESATDPSTAPAIKKGRGRPKKSTVARPATADVDEAESATNTALPVMANSKRPRGRPKKTPNLTTTTSENTSKPAPVSDSDNNTGMLPANKGRGRPKKVESEAESKSLPDDSPPPVKKVGKGKGKKEAAEPVVAKGRATRSRAVEDDAAELPVRKRAKRPTG